MIVQCFNSSLWRMSVICNLYVQFCGIARAFEFCSAFLCSWLGKQRFHSWHFYMSAWCFLHNMFMMMHICAQLKICYWFLWICHLYVSLLVLGKASGHIAPLFQKRPSCMYVGTYDALNEGVHSIIEVSSVTVTCYIFSLAWVISQWLRWCTLSQLTQLWFCWDQCKVLLLLSRMMIVLYKTGG